VSKDENHTFNKKTGYNRRRNIVKVFALLVTVLLLGIGGFVSYNAGFIPIKELLETQEPIGKAEEINIDEYMDEYPEIENIPNLDKLKYKAYGTDESIDAVANDYKQKLENDGYSIKYEGTVYKRGIPFQCYGFLKRFTAVGIIMTSDANVTFGHETRVLYTTGSVFDYREIMNFMQ
jgi:hypothetical protein